MVRLVILAAWALAEDPADRPTVQLLAAVATPAVIIAPMTPARILERRDTVARRLTLNEVPVVTEGVQVAAWLVRRAGRPPKIDLIVLLLSN
jgi:hypothetical protein